MMVASMLPSPDAPVAATALFVGAKLGWIVLDGVPISIIPGRVPVLRLPPPVNTDWARSRPRLFISAVATEGRDKRHAASGKPGQYTFSGLGGESFRHLLQGKCILSRFSPLQPQS